MFMNNGNGSFTFIQSFPFQIDYFGLRGTTLSLQQQGWQLSVNERRAVDRFGFELQIVGFHPGTRTYLYTERLTLDIPLPNIDMMKNICFKCVASAQVIKVIMPELDKGRIMFTPIDATPRILNDHEVDLANITFFTPLGQNIQQIYLPNEKSISDTLTEILEKQAPFQAELREKKRKAEKSPLIDVNGLPLSSSNEKVMGQLILVS